MSGDHQIPPHFSRLRQYQSLLVVSAAISAQRDISSLVETLIERLHTVVELDAFSLVLYEPTRDLVPESESLKKLPLLIDLPIENSPGGWVWREQQPLILPNLAREGRFPEFVEASREGGIESSCFLPLTSNGRHLGAIGFGRTKASSYSEIDLDFLQQFAKQVAVALNNAIDFEEALTAERELRLLLEINNSVVSFLDLQQLFRAIAACLRRLIPHDAASLMLFDAESEQLRVIALDSPVIARGGPVVLGGLVPLEDTPGGIAFNERRTVVVRLSDLQKFHSPHVRRLIAGGLKSGVITPLIFHGRVLGTLGVGSLKDEAFSEIDAGLIERIGAQIAIAMANALNYDRARQAEEEIRRRFERERLMLEINNVVVSQLDLRDLVRVVSSCLRDVLQSDITGISLYDAESDQLRAYVFDLPSHIPPIEEGTPISLRGSAGGYAFYTGQPIFINHTNLENTTSEFDRRLIDAGIRSGGCVPLVARGRKLGVLGVGSLRENTFSEADQELLCHIANQIAIAVENALAYREIESLKNKLNEEKLYLEEEINTSSNFEEIIGSSQVLRRLLKHVETVAPTDSTVLIQGETGTGKELIARAIHSLSSRRERTLVKLNCAAIPTGLIESELFGHEKGSFTGAIAQRIGRFELAHKGTIFLDEVGELPLELQPKLLRVLQEQEFERLGSARTQRVDVRLIAATNRDLAQMSAENRFRSDLYYRLNVFPITIPPLRERPEDIPVLVRFFANKFVGRLRKNVESIPADAVAALQQYHWPGNIRELENFIERAVILTQGPELQIPISEINLPTTFAMSASKPAIVKAVAPSSPTQPPTDTNSLVAIEREHILRILHKTNWVVGGPTGAAAQLGMKRTTLQNRIRKLGITRQN
jgi:formate hydrogenlyase transcriptional activator